MEEILRLREAATVFGDTLGATTKLMNATWPYYDLEDLDWLAEEQVKAKTLESIHYLTRVRRDQRASYLDFQAGICERWVKAGCMRAYGNLDVLVQDGYMNDILEFIPQGAVPSSDKDEYYALAYRYPPPNSYLSSILTLRASTTTSSLLSCCI